MEYTTKKTDKIDAIKEIESYSYKVMEKLKELKEYVYLDHIQLSGATMIILSNVADVRIKVEGGKLTTMNGIPTRLKSSMDIAEVLFVYSDKTEVTGVVYCSNEDMSFKGY